MFSWIPLKTFGAPEDGSTLSGWNIDDLLADEQGLEEAARHWSELSRDRPYVRINATAEGMESEAQWIQDNLCKVVDRVTRA